MMIKAVYNAKPIAADEKITADKLGKVVYVLDVDTVEQKATIAYPINEDESAFKIVGLGALRIIDENITGALYFSAAPLLKSNRPAPAVKSVYAEGTKTVKADFKVDSQKK